MHSASRLTLVTLTVFTSVVSQLQAEVILDTGPIRVGQFGEALADTIWQARRFEIIQPTIVTALEGYMYGTLDDRPAAPGEVIASIYSHGENALPDERLFEETFIVPHTPRSEATWYGVTNQNWELPAGTYWAAFAVEETEHSSLVMPFDDTGGEHHAQRVDVSVPDEPPIPPFWRASNTPRRNMGFRVLGEPVPEPATTLLLKIAAMLIVPRTRRKSV